MTHPIGREKQRASKYIEADRLERQRIRETFTAAEVAVWGTWTSPLPLLQPPLRAGQRHWAWSDEIGDMIEIPAHAPMASDLWTF
jgi:hypothetical protein